ncbi:sigma-70 family RNA polymerase sigma factor [Hyunsoonleella sp. SJ7]|uniref:Sigma-70 family RNA polymerase sigma factor n=1 Tax=Hyunsoonleella aquatilis TaxID=2762758 RepID=A0A923HDP0_9FLAO|nr:sigma-70 family RNA polymerase sigma factor [Hyunsoonleella aquatilis]MBC3759266.1 sigma-70 family RNA polymerase sigma factor [Hyunsoonleella aquatilis]
MLEKDTLQKDLSGQQQLIQSIKANDESSLKQLYKDNFYKTEQYILNNSGSIEEAKDIFQEAFVTVWENVQDNKFVPKNQSALNGYLYSIAKNKWLNHLNSARYRKTNSYDNNMHVLNDESIEMNIEPENNDNLNLIANAFNNLGEACKKLLSAFYYDNKSLKDIAKVFEITEASARNKKYRCTEKLRSLTVKHS